MTVSWLAICPRRGDEFTLMNEAKNTARALVRLGYDGRVHKTFKGHLAKERFEHEVRVLKYLEKQGCTFVPKVLETDPEKLYLVTSNCGQRVEKLTEDKLRQIYAELEQYGVRHDDPYTRNVTYNAKMGRFCLIDFEFATILDQPDLGPPAPEPDPVENGPRGW
jgi:tRNA A-37 threonylcarbamoyl transferase component Bud32